MATSTATLSKLPIVNMPWIGPPTQEDAKAHQDIDGPLLMAAHCKNPVIFWCLPEHLSHYQKVFEKQKERYKSESGKQLDITVRSTDELLEKKTDDTIEKQAIEQFKAIQKECLRPERNQIRDRVTVKNAFTLLLLLLHGGYVADTNVSPANNKEFTLQHYENFKCPIVSMQYHTTFEYHPEIWLMYSPLEKQDFIKKVFAEYYKKWGKAEEDLQKVVKDIKKFGYPESYHNSMGLIVTDTIKKCADEQQFKQGDFWCGNWGKEANNLFILQELNILKRYDRTHVRKDNPFTLFSQTKPVETKQDTAYRYFRDLRYQIEYIMGDSLIESLKKLLDNCEKFGNRDLSRTDELGDIVSEMKKPGPINPAGKIEIEKFLESILKETALFKYFVPNQEALGIVKEYCFEDREEELDNLFKQQNQNRLV